MFNKRIFAAGLAATLLLSLPGCAAQPLQSTAGNGTVAGYSSYSDSSNLYTHLYDKTHTQGLTDMTVDGYELIAQNEKLALYLRKDSASIRVVDLKSGYVWGALRQDKPEDLNKTWSSFANSIVSIRFYDEAGSISQIGAGHEDNKCTYEAVDNGVIIHAEFTEQQIYLSAKVELLEDHIRFSLDDSSIEEKGSYVLAQVHFAPFLGSTVGDEIDGYLFVPDGSGALIRFQRPIKYLAGYADRVYGSDYAIDNTYTVGDLNANRSNDFLKDSQTITMPVYGISHGFDSHALFGHVESGAAYSTVMADPAGIITNYNYATAYFVYRQTYLQPTGRNGAGIQMVQKDANVVNPALSVYFLTGTDANYVGMAHLYKDILENSGILPGAELSQPALMLDYIVSDIREGFLFNSTVKLTGAQNLLDAAAYLQQQEIDRTSVQLMGWQKGGLNGYKKLDTFTSTELGNLPQLAQFKQTLLEAGCDLSLYMAPLSVKTPQINAKSHLGIALSQEVIEITRDNKSVFLPDTQYLKTSTALNVLGKQVEALRQAGLTNFVTDELGQLLYGEMMLDEEQSRTKVMEQVRQTLTELAGQEGLTLYSPNEYLLGVTSVYREAPMGSSRYAFETDSVPFLQIVLSGEMTMYAPYANQSFYTDMDVLKCIEYNAYPSFLLTGSDSKELSGTPSQEYFSTCFEDWKETAVSIYRRIDQVLSNVHGQQMVGHTALQEGLILVEYSGGGKIYVNYTQQQIELGSVRVPAMSAVFVDKQ